MPDEDPNSNPIEFDAPSPWAVEVEPTRLVMPWPGDTQPTLTEVTAALTQHFGEAITIEDELDPPDDDVAWAAVLRLPGASEVTIVWTEPSRPMPQVFEDQIDVDAINAATWALGAETVLDGDDPLADYTLLVRALASSWPDAPALFDLNSNVCHPRSRLDEVFLDPEIDPPAEALWIQHCVHSGEPSAPGTTFWLHTHGLWRCGWAELEMVEVPAEHASAAAELLNTLADHVVESGLPDPGEPWEIGPGLTVVAQPWQEIAPYVSPGASGGMKDRKGDAEENPHAGVRAVICSPRKKGAFRKVWAWPEEVVDALNHDEATVWFTQRATERQAKLARKHFDEFATAFAAAQSLPPMNGGKRAIFALKAGFAAPGEEQSGEAGHEHLWFEVESVDEVIRGTLANDPIHVPMERGQTYDIRRDQISDWTMITPLGNFDPSRAPELWPTIERLRGA